MKKTTTRKLVLGREVVKALVTELQVTRLQDARGGLITDNGSMGCSGPNCSDDCSSIVRTR
jgi:hypothetical protein